VIKWNEKEDSVDVKEGGKSVRQVETGLGMKFDIELKLAPFTGVEMTVKSYF